jgi:hypothetical protein
MGLSAQTAVNKNVLVNKFLFGLTVTAGVAAVAMYAINTNGREPQDLLSKIFHLITYKEF